ncbi:protein QUIRKY [Carya illinoinensis]|uniref:protein QUIRKY n=1 Tax=Carya illinoinensis TaxID=32201 RepID=UPI001C7183E2|nr:protein QUIRKY [Carya illinoinensis]
MATVRKLIVEVVEARNLLPIDGNGTASPYVQIDFYGQRKRTRTKIRDLNPTWNELLEFNVGKPSEVFGDILEVDIYHDRNHGQTRKNNFLGRIRLNSTQFVRKGEEALMYFPLEKKNIFYWVRGDIGLKIYFVDEVVPPPTPPPQPPAEEVKPELPSPPPVDSLAPPENEPKPPSEANGNEESAAPPPEPTASADAQKPNEEPPADAKGASNLAPEAAPPTENVAPPPTDNVAPDQMEKRTEVSESEPPQPSEKNEDQTDQPPLIECKQPYPQIGMMATSTPKSPESAPEVSFSKISCPKPIKMTMGRERFTALDPTESMKIEPPSFELVEKMHYLFVRVVKARSLPTNGNPVVKILASSHHVRSKPARKTDNLFVWNQTFAFGHDAPDSSSLLEVTVWDPPANSDKHGHGTFLGWVGFDVTEIPLRDPPDSPLATQWYRLEGAGPHNGDLMLATWVGTQADEAFPEACNINSQAKVYQSPKLWYLRATVLDAQDILPLKASKESSFQVRAQLGLQVSKTKLSVSRNGTLSWNEDLMFVAAEPSNDHLVFTLENRQPKATVTIGVVRIPLTAIERRVDDRPISSTWFSFEDPDKEKRMYKGRVQLRLCFDGGYHVMDEATHVCSDYRPTARQLWKPPIGKVELGIISCKNLTPMKTVISGKGSTDAYCVAKYGSKWVRTRTVFDSLDPKWNEQYTWQVYDPCTVLTIGVFDSWAVHGMEEGSKESTRPDLCIGKVRVRLSTLQISKVYRNKYPLLVLYNSGMKQMGEVEIAIRFARAVPTLDVVHVYSQPLLPLMHHIKPLGMDQQDILRNTTVKIVAAHLSRSEPPLRREVVFYMLDADTHAFSMRKLRVNWFRIANMIAGLIDIARWINDTRLWKNPTSTILVHALFVMLVWFPDLIVPTLAFYVFVIGGWNYRFRARDSLPHFDTQISLVDTVDRDELDEEFDTVPCNRPNEVVRARYDKLRIIGARVQRALGDIATQGERAQALVTWRDPRASGIFVGLCFVVAMILYMVPSKMVAMAFGFYYFRHPLFRNRMPSPALNFFRRLPSLGDRII